jgi:hypothetical protein
MKLFKKTWRAAALWALFTACAGMHQAPYTAGDWEWRNVNSEIAIPLYPGQEGKGPGMNLSYRLLDLEGSGKEAQTLRQLLYDGGTPETWRDKSGEALRNEYFSMREEAGARPGMADESLNWFYAETVDCGAESPRYAVIRRVRESYLGGAHGMRETEYFLVGRNVTGRIPLDRIIRKDAGPALVRLAEEELRRHFDIAAGRPLTDVLFGEKLEMTDNFFLSPDGLGLHWDPYEIAPYSAGPVELSIPWDRCAGLLGGEGLQIAGDFGFL